MKSRDTIKIGFASILLIISAIVIWSMGSELSAIVNILSSYALASGEQKLQILQQEVPQIEIYLTSIIIKSFLVGAMALITKKLAWTYAVSDKGELKTASMVKIGVSAVLLITAAMASWSMGTDMSTLISGASGYLIIPGELKAQAFQSLLIGIRMTASGIVIKSLFIGGMVFIAKKLMGTFVADGIEGLNTRTMIKVGASAVLGVIAVNLLWSMGIDDISNLTGYLQYAAGYFFVVSETEARALKALRPEMKMILSRLVIKFLLVGALLLIIKRIIGSMSPGMWRENSVF